METTFRLNNTRIKAPVFTGFRLYGLVTLGAQRDKFDLRPETVNLCLKFQRGGRFVDPQKFSNTFKWNKII